MFNIAKNFDKIVTMKQKLGIYVHIPFCEGKCDYCNFVSFKTDVETKERYVLALIKEMELFAPNIVDYEIDTIFIGGGTPSCLRPKAIKNILNYITNNFNVTHDAEITIEANPNSLTVDKLREYKLAGVNRLSIGLQAYNDNLLELIGRLHTKSDFDTALYNAKTYGFENINVDLLLGLPKQNLYDILYELKHLVKCGVKHISAYGLIVEEGTKLQQKLDKKEYTLPNEEKALKMYNTVVNFLKKNGLNRYEVSNFAVNGYESKHNLKYWTMQEYVGFGLASHSFFNGKRWENTAKLQEYFDLIENDTLPRKNVEEETMTDLKEEFIMTEIRKQSGIDLSKYIRFFGEDLLEVKHRELDSLKKLGLIEITPDNRLFATDRGFEVLNQIILELI